MSSPLDIAPLTGCLGAEIRGVDLSRPLTDGTFDAIHQALLDHMVIFFRDQDITPGQHKALARRFGDLQQHPVFPTVEGHPEVVILECDEANPPTVEEWHTDVTFKEKPPLGSVLHAQVVPDVGGDTMWSNMVAAYEALSDRMQTFLYGLEAVHSFAHGFRHTLAARGHEASIQEAVRKNPPVRHPVIRTHPMTKRKGLFVNQLFTTQIVGMKEAESQAILRFLAEHIAAPELTCRFRWSPKALAIWDNRVTQHKPVNDFYPKHRKLHRVVIEGDQPY